MIMAASPRHSGHKTTAHSNNNGRSNNRSPDPPVLPTIESMPESSEYGKKHKSNITLRRLWTKFHLLSRPLQIIAIGFISIVIGLVAMSTFNLLISSSKQQPNSSKLHTYVASAKQGGETIIKGAKEDGKQPPHHVINLPQNTDKAAMAKMKNRPQISGASKRVVELMDGDVTNVADKESEDGKVPKFGVHELVERYNPMPHEMPALKGASTMDKGQCQAIADWQKGHDPTCNIIHEMTWGWDHLYGDKENLHHLTDDDEEARLKAGGAFRHVWMIREFDGTKRALKTLRASKAKDFDLRNFDRHRRDAVAFEQLTASPLIVDMYGYCTQSALFDWGEGGDLLSIFEREPHISNEKLLKIAYNASSAIADAHHPDEHGRPTMAHTDIKPDQFLYQDGYYRLTDFNRVRFLMWNDEKDLQCGFTVGKNGGIWRSPEEYHYDVENEKVDVYSLGNVLYFLLTRQNPWRDVPAKDVYDLVMKGKRPKIPTKILQSDELFHKYMIQALEMAYTHRAIERPGAREVAAKLKEGIDEL